MNTTNQQLSLGGADTTAVIESIGKPPMRYAAMHRHVLSGVDGDVVGEDGKMRAVATPPDMPGAHSQLIPKLEAQAAVSELEGALTPALYDQARAVARLIVGRYAYSEKHVHDPEVFVFEVTRLLAEAPADLAVKAADKLRDRKFLPNVGDISEVLDPMVRARKWALRCAKAHVAEHDRRSGKTDAKAPRATADDVDEIAKKFAAEHGVPFTPGMSVVDVLKMTTAPMVVSDGVDTDGGE